MAGVLRERALAGDEQCRVKGRLPPPCSSPLPARDLERGEVLAQRNDVLMIPREALFSDRPHEARKTLHAILTS
jgi:hypothetical protein